MRKGVPQNGGENKETSAGFTFLHKGMQKKREEQYA